MRGLLAAALVASAVNVQANVFNLPGETSVQFVTVGDPGNLPDPATGNLYGSVPYTFQMGTYDVTTGQYVAFLNAVATQSDPYSLYNANMALGATFPTVGISQTLISGTYSYAVTGSASGAASMPVFDVTWGDAARFCNWLQNGQPTSGTEAAGTTETGGIRLTGQPPKHCCIRRLATPAPPISYPRKTSGIRLPTTVGGGTNSAYYTYPTKSNTAPINTLPDTGNHANFYDGYGTGNTSYTDSTNYLTPVGSFVLSPGPYETYDMGGDVFQWNEAQISGSFRGLLGGSWGNYSDSLASSNQYDADPSDEDLHIGFRVASSVATPEPGSWRCCLPAQWRSVYGDNAGTPDSLSILGHKASVLHRPATIGGEDRIEAVEEHRGVAIHEGGQAADSPAANTVAADLPSLFDATRPVEFPSSGRQTRTSGNSRLACQATGRRILRTRQRLVGFARRLSDSRLPARRRSPSARQDEASRGPLEEAGLVLQVLRAFDAPDHIERLRRKIGLLGIDAMEFCPRGDAIPIG